MSYTNNNNINYGKFDIKDVTKDKNKNPTPAWQNLIKNGEFISGGKLLIVNGTNIMDAVYASGADFEITLVNLSENNDNQIGEILSAFPKINYEGSDIHSLNNLYFENFDFVYETAFNLIDEPERKNYLKQLCNFIKPEGRLITIFSLLNKSSIVETQNISPVQYNNYMPDFMKLEFSSKYSTSNKSKQKTEVLQVYYKPKGTK